MVIQTSNGYPYSCIPSLQPYQVNSPVLTKEYLETINESYMTKYLPDAGQYSELLVYKWNKPAESLEDMVLDIENLNMDDWDIKGQKFKDWGFYWNEFYDINRYTFTSEKAELINDFIATPIWDVDSLVLDDEEAEHRDEVYASFVSIFWSTAQKRLFTK